MSPDVRLQTSDFKVLLAGVSTRAAAESAARAGFAVTTIDAFADLDQHPAVVAQSLGASFSPAAVVRIGQTISCDAVAYGSNFENHPDAVSALAAGRALWGNPSGVLNRVRNPVLLSQTLRRRGLAAPEVRDVSDESRVPNPESRQRWIVKPRASGGGHRVREWRRGTRVPRGSCLQEFIDGAPGSIVFVAAHGHAVPIGLSRQIIGDHAFGASGFRYCGNILAAGDDDAILDAACALASAVCEEFGLVGVNGVDFMARDGVPYAIEVNPRWCASMELVERAYRLSVFGMHAAACRNGVLADFDLARARRAATTMGKAVVFARRDVTVGNTAAWLQDSDLRDIPKPGTAICSGQPVCTVFGAGGDAAACHAELVRRAARVYALLDVML